MATRCMVWLVEPPVAIRPIRALMKDFFGQHFAQGFDGAVLMLARGVRQRSGQCFAQVGIRVDEGGGRQVYAHHFHHHLVGVGGAVEGTSTRAVVRTHFASKQGITADLPSAKSWRVRAFSLLPIPLDIGPAGTKMPGIWPNDNAPIIAERFVAYAHKQTAVKHLMRQTDGGTHGNHVAGKRDNSMPA